jgi:hypothetical protein
MPDPASTKESSEFDGVAPRATRPIVIFLKSYVSPHERRLLDGRVVRNRS